MEKKYLNILGIRGIPARHGGFETFAEQLSQYLANRGWKVTVYCQETGWGNIRCSSWNGINLVHVRAGNSGTLSTIIFDLITVLLAARRGNIILTLGYNTAVFNIVFRVLNIPNIINMDGLEWKRDKWKKTEQAWLRLNEKIACRLGTRLIADNPGIQQHLGLITSNKKIKMIPYGANEVLSADSGLLGNFRLEQRAYMIVVARPEPENMVLEIVRTFSRTNRGIQLVVLGNFDTENNAYHQAVVEAASEEVFFPGAIYEKNVVESLRYYALCYIHGHKVGGTNPSLVEAMGCGNPIIAFDNPFNRWVAKNAAIYFKDESDLEAALLTALNNHTEMEFLAKRARIVFEENFRWDTILAEYEAVLGSQQP